MLVHEHVLVDFVGAADIRPGRYDPNDVFALARSRLEELKRLGCRRLLECTPNFLGRDPELLARLSATVGIQIWSNTGLYGAANHKYVPDFARSETAAQLAKRWIAETREPWRPRFIKIGVNRGPLDELDRKLVRAAAITSRETGLAIASHTGDGAAAVEQLEIVTAEKVSPAKFVWVHAQNEKDHGVHEKMARAGAWVEFDGIGPRRWSFTWSAFVSWQRKTCSRERSSRRTPVGITSVSRAVANSGATPTCTAISCRSSSPHRCPSSCGKIRARPLAPRPRH
jgi:phosphotriesterase-related protein